MNVAKWIVLGVCAAMLAAASQGPANAAQSRSASTRSIAASPAPARSLVERTVQAMGGTEKLNAIRNITANGYAQYAYMWGGGRIDGAVEAPEKYVAANDLRRVYDLEHDRFQMQERRNMLFPFLAVGGHNFAPNNWILDGDVAFNRDEAGKATRQAVRTEGVQWNDGVHMRRMWMMNNPVVLLRAMTDPATRLGAPRREGANTVVEVHLKQGDKLFAGFRPDGLPAFVRWGSWHTNLGQVNFTTWFSGWSAWDGQGGLLMPLGYSTRLDWRNVDYFKMYVDAYQVNTEIADLAAPADVKNAPVPPSNPFRALTSVPAGRGIWRISNGTTVIAFKDHLVLYELNGPSDGAEAVLAYARSLAPGKPIKYLVTSHNHPDHVTGIRQAVAAGITLIQRPSTIQELKEMAEHPAPDYPDDLARKPMPFKSMTMGDHLRLSDETQTLDLYWGRNNGHMADVVFGYVPSAKLMMEGDMVTAAYDWQHWPDAFRDVIAYYKLDVDKVSPVHGQPRIAPDLLTHAQAEELLSGGTKRARQHCAELQSTGVYHPGCPIQSKYY
jgi:glyoxylase-like metal-dependent hydrolase (beta-lactamase superfamily II)